MRKPVVKKLGTAIVFLALAFVMGARSAIGDTLFTVSGTFGDNGSTPLAGTVTMNTTTGAIENFNFHVPTMVVGTTTVAGLDFTPTTAVAGFYTTTDSEPFLGFAIDGAAPGDEDISLLIPQTTLVGYSGGTILPSAPCSACSGGNWYSGFADFAGGGFVKLSAGTITGTAAPEPTSFLMFGAGLLGLLTITLRRKWAAQWPRSIEYLFHKTK